MQLKSQLLSAISLFCFSSVIYAASSGYVGPENDLSIFYLKNFFGSLVQTPESGAASDGIFVIIMRLSLQAALLGGVSIFAYITTLSTIRGSHEGSFLGKDASSLLTSLRTLLGLTVMIPRADGYASLQHVFMWLVLKGVFLANNMWSLIEPSGEKTLPDTQRVVVAPLEAEELTLSLYKVITAVQVAQNNFGKEEYNLVIDNQGTVFLAHLDSRLEVAKIPARSVPGIDYQKLYTLVDSTLPGQFVENNLSIELLRDWEPFFQAQIEQDALKITDYFFELNKTRNPQAPDLLERIEKKEGWMSAGVYYWDLFTDNSFSQKKEDLLKKACANSCNIQPSQIFINERGISDILDSRGAGSNDSGAQGVREKIVSIYDDFYKEVKKKKNAFSSGQARNAFGNAYSLLQEKISFLPMLSLDDFLPKEVYDFDLSGADTSVFKKDRLRILIEKNFSVIENVLTIFLTTVAMAIGLQVGGLFKGFYSGIAFSLLNTFFFAMFFLFGLAVAFIPPAVLGSMYLSLIPGIIFFSASLAWFMKVIEAIVLAPIMTIGLMSPSRDEFARLRTIFQNLLVIIFKPSLMMIGLVIASKLVNIALLFSSVILSNLFEVVMENFSPGFLGSMLFLGILFNVSTLLTINIVTRAFGAIYLVPDQVFVSIGVHSEAGDESREMIMAMQQSARQASQSITGTLSLIDSVYRSFANKKRTKEFFASFSSQKKGS